MKENKKLKNLYTDPSFPGSFSGASSFIRSVKEINKKQNPQKIKEWLLEQETYTLHKPKLKKFIRNKVIVAGIDDCWQADLVDVQAISDQNDGNKYILTCIDVFSKYAWAIPLKNKTGKSITEAFSQIFQHNRVPKKLQVDKGSEFYNATFKSLLNKHDILMYSTKSELKACIVERFNRTLKERMWRYFNEKNTHKYLNVLDQLISSYNNTYHRSIKTKPINVNKENELKIFTTLYGYERNVGDENKIEIKFKVGDKVRISKMKRVFEKGYTPNWTREIFVIHQVLATNPPTFIIKDLENEIIEGTFYQSELQKIYKYDDVFKINEIIKTRTLKNGKKEYLVNWLGYPDKFNSWTQNIEEL
jgi:hypothetical protein